MCEAEIGGLGERERVLAIGEGGSAASAEDERAEGEVKFPDQTGAEEGLVEFAAAFDEQVADAMVVGEPAEGGGEVELMRAKRHHLGAGLFEPSNALGWGLAGDQDDDGPSGRLEQWAGWIQRSPAAGDYADRCIGEAARPAELPVAGWARPERRPGSGHGPGAAQDGIGLGAELVEVLPVTVGSEGVDGVVGGGNAAVGAQGEVQPHEREAGCGCRGRCRVPPVTG